MAPLNSPPSREGLQLLALALLLDVSFSTAGRHWHDVTLMALESRLLPAQFAAKLTGSPGLQRRSTVALPSEGADLLLDTKRRTVLYCTCLSDIEKASRPPPVRKAMCIRSWVGKRLPTHPVSTISRHARCFPGVDNVTSVFEPSVFVYGARRPLTLVARRPLTTVARDGIILSLW